MTFSSRYPLLLLPFLALACGPPTEERVVYDLVADLSAAEVLVEPTRLELGGPAARAYFRGGFSRGAVDATDNMPYVWGLGEASEMRIPLVAKRDLSLTFEVKPLDWEVAPAQHIKVLLNGVEVDDLEFWPGRREHSVVLPAAAQRLGENVLRFEYRWSRSPRELFPGNSDNRQLAVAWYWLRLGDRGEAEVPRGEDELLVLPVGSQIDYHLMLPAAAELYAQSWAVRGGQDARLEVAVEEADGARTERRPEIGSGPLRLPLAISKSKTSRLVRLSLRAVPGTAGEAAAVVLRQPRILAQMVIEDKSPVAAGAETVVGASTNGERRPDLLVYLIDTLRADYLGVYGQERDLSPRIDAFAAGATVFANAQAQSSWTRSSVASIFTGLWPLAHGANRRTDKLSSEALTLAELLGAAGYRTAAFVTNPNVTPTFGFDQGFDHFEYLGEAATASEVSEQVLQWLDDSNAGGESGAEEDRPLLLYVHTIDPHTPYVPAAELRRRFAPGISAAAARRSSQTVNDLQAGRRPVTPEALTELTSLYAAEVAAADAGFGELLDGLEGRDRLRHTAVVMLSDHGEEFYEHGNFEHGKALHVESLRVPLIIRLPAQTVGQRCSEMVQHIDLLPTLLELAVASGPGGLGGRSLVSLLDGGGNASDGSLGERPHHAYLHLDGPARVAILEGGYKAIHRVQDGRLIWPRLFDLAADPEELAELEGERPLRLGYMAAQTRARLARPGGLSAERADLDEELRDSLRALGYLD